MAERIGQKAEKHLGLKLDAVRRRKGMSRLQVGQRVNRTEQQIAKYENGEMVPIPMLEALAEAMGEPIQRKFIRRISFLRKLEIETKKEQLELIDLYDEIFQDALAAED